ncbi:MAG: alpha/beta hydrolase [Verrucomicrobia bacterium]|nr:alpha/beta hydrolase [Verrucomicrobiota bacterium]
MITTIELSQAIATSWDQIANALGDDRASFEYQLTTLLRQLDAVKDPAQPAVIKLILDLFQGYNAAHKELIKAISRVAPRSKGVEISPVFLMRKRYTSVPVFYGTDRAIDNGLEVPVSYGSERGELALGMAEVSIPDDHRMGTIERPMLWKLQFRESPEKHVLVLQIEPLSFTAFKARAQNLLTHGSSKEVLLFVHGYNVGFSEALSRTAQIAYDLKFEGLPVLYSWPSAGSTPKYLVDETNVTWSRPRFAQFLSLLRENLGAETIHIIAHSMGNRLVTETLSSLTQPLPVPGACIRQVVFAAPDIDAATFKDLVEAFHHKAERFTLYASSKDKALKASKLIHRYARAGESGPALVVVDSVDTVDATSVDTSLLGHSYYGDNRSVLADLFQLIQRGSPPEDRFSLVQQQKYGARYWLFRP